MIEKTLRKYLWKIAAAYQDDESVATDEEEESVPALRKVLRRYRKKLDNEVEQVYLVVQVAG